MENLTTYDYQQKVEQIRQAMQCDFVAIALVQSEKHHFQVHWECATGNLSQRFQRTVLQSGKGVAGLVFKTGKPIWVPESRTFFEKDDLYNYAIISSEKLASFAAFPLFTHNRVKGVLLAGYRKPDRMSEERVEQLRLLIAPTLDSYYSEELTGK